MECLHHPPGFLRIQCDPSLPNEYPIDSHFFHAVHVVFYLHLFSLFLALYPVFAGDLLRISAVAPHTGSVD